MDLSRCSMKKIRELIVFTAFLVVALWKFDVVIEVLKSIWKIVFPFALGGAIAFVINVPMSFLEKKMLGKIKENNNIVGFAGIKKILDEVDLMNIVTQKSKRNFGIASMLLENLINKSIELGASTITLEVDENNSPALHLYEKYNFKKVGLRKKYYNGINNAVIMTKDLKNF